MVAAGASVTLEQGKIVRAGIALAAVGGGITSEHAERALIGKRPSDDRVAEAAARAAAARSGHRPARGRRSTSGTRPAS